MKREILIETMTANQGNIITEDMTSKNGKFYLQGIFAQAGIKNRNGRVYSLQEMASNVESMRQQISEYGGVFGELDHPDTITINMDRISHAIKDLHMDGNNVIGKAELLKTPMGEIARVLAQSGVRYGVSTRGAGIVSESGEVSGYNMSTIDLVATPSAPGAMPETVTENLNDAIESAKIMTLAESLQHDPKAQKYFEREMKKFISTTLQKVLGG